MSDDAFPDAVDPDLRMSASGVLYRRLLGDQAALIEFMAGDLARVLPGAVKIKHRGLLGGGPVERVEVRLADAVHELEARDGVLRPSRGSIVQGVVLQRSPMALDQWITSLLSHLEQWASQSEATRAALVQLGLGR